jgi:AbrB family looped-hinge helix DNA binding protein
MSRLNERLKHQNRYTVHHIVYTRKTLITTVSEKGWIVIPKEIRDRYGLSKGTKVVVVDWGGQIYMFPAMKDPIHDARGIFKDGPSLTDALLEDRREALTKEEADIAEATADPATSR